MSKAVQKQIVTITKVITSKVSLAVAINDILVAKYEESVKEEEKLSKIKQNSSDNEE